jgi:hypothetical protein
VAPRDVAHVAVRQVACEMVEVVEHREHPREGDRWRASPPCRQFSDHLFLEEAWRSSAICFLHGTCLTVHADVRGRIMTWKPSF